MQRMKNHYTHLCQRIWSYCITPSRTQVQCLLFLFGLVLLAAGLIEGAQAQFGGKGHHLHYNDERLAESINAILTYVEGTFGAMVMVAAGIGAILSSAFGQYRAALGLLVVAVGAFILRSLVGTFFNDVNIQS